MRKSRKASSIFSPMARGRATRERQARTNSRKNSRQKESGRTLVRPLCEITKTSRNPKLIALPQYEARANHLLRLRLCLFLLLRGHDGDPRCLCDEPTAGLVQSG